MNTSGSMQPSNLPGSGIPSQQAEKRSWRVGSLSMGITLMLIGTAFAVSLWQDAEAYELLLWVAPIVFILLGIELLIHLKMNSERNTIVRYDWISVFFVGVMGMGSLVMGMLMSTGLFDEIKHGLEMTQRTAYVETEKKLVPSEVNKIIVQTTDGVTFEETNTREVQLMGQIRYRSAEPISNVNESIMRTNIVGSTMYIIIGSIDRRNNEFTSDYHHSMLMLALPKGVKVEERR